jgi:hypothetical protein
MNSSDKTEPAASISKLQEDIAKLKLQLSQEATKKCNEPKRICGTCEWFEPDDLMNTGGECLKNPPTIVFDHEVQSIQSYYPDVSTQARCSYWLKKV